VRVVVVATVLSVALLPLSSCELFEDGYALGYNAVDWVLTAAEERQAVQDEWRAACGVPVEPFFDDAAALQAADESCRDRSPTRDQLTVCEDPGQEPGSHPGDCVSYRAPLVIPQATDYGCPASVPDGFLCLCCRDDRPAGCGLRGDFCTENADCCEGGCSVDVDGRGECL
jgi:hypothetical protein